MAQTKTFKCSNCGTEISANGFVLFCPNCKKPIIARIVALVVAIVLIIVSIFYINSLMHKHDKELYGYRQAIYTNYV